MSDSNIDPDHYRKSVWFDGKHLLTASIKHEPPGITLMWHHRPPSTLSNVEGVLAAFRRAAILEAAQRFNDPFLERILQ